MPWVDPYQYVNRLFDGRTIQATGNTDLSYFNSAHYNKLIDRGRGALRQRTLRGLRQARRRPRQERRADGRDIHSEDLFLISKRVGCVSITAHGLDLTGLCLTQPP